MNNRFAIYHNIPKACDITIHYTTCGHYRKREVPDAKNSDWHTAPDLDSALAIAKDLARMYTMKYRGCMTCKIPGAPQKSTVP